MATTSGTSMDERPLPFLSLPSELRMLIYLACMDSQGEEKHAVSAMAPISVTDGIVLTHPSKTGFTLPLFYPLLRTCRLIRNEATSIFDNHGQPIPSIRLLYAFLRSIGRARRAKLQNLAFVYCFTSNHETWEDKLAQGELATKCFRLIARECRKVRSLRVHMDEQYLRTYSLISCSGDCSGHADINRQALEEFEIRMVNGMHELRKIRGIERVEFMPAIGAEDFNKKTYLVLDGFAREMMKPKKEKEIDKTIRLE